MPSYIVQEEDGTSKFTLEEGGGSLLTEESVAGGGGGGTTGSGLMALLGVGEQTMENNDG